MPNDTQAEIRIGDLILLGNYWVQVPHDQEVRVQLEDLYIIFRFEDFDTKGNVETVSKQTDDKKGLILTYKYVGNLGIGTHGTSRPANIGRFKERELWLSYTVQQFKETAHIHLALYAGGQTRDGTNARE